MIPGIAQGNKTLKEVAKVLKKYGMNFDKFLCGCCSKRKHRTPETWEDDGLCEAQMVGTMVIVFTARGNSDADIREGSKLLEKWIKKYRPSEFRLHDIFIGNKALEEARP